MIGRLSILLVVIIGSALILKDESPKIKIYDRAKIVKPLTTNKTLQTKSELTLKKYMQLKEASSGVVLISDVNTGQVKAAVSIDKQGKICRALVYCQQGADNLALMGYQPGSVMKMITTAVALDTGSINEDFVFYNKGFQKIKNRQIVNVEPYSAREFNLRALLKLSLNTGAVEILKNIGQDKIDNQAILTFNKYLTTNFGFGSRTRIVPREFEKAGYVRPPVGGRNLELSYATMTFGVGLTVTPVQLISSYSSLVNGGIYIPPRIDQSRAYEHRAIEASASKKMISLLSSRPISLKANEQFVTGGKSGTAPIMGFDENYLIDKDNGTFIGYVGKEKPELMVLARLDEPVTDKYASKEASEMWIDIVQQIINFNYLH